MERITIVQIAEKANVSKTTVSKYLNGGCVREKYRVKIEKVLNTLNYHPNLVAKALRTKQTYTIGILIPFINDRYSTQIVSSMEKRFQEKGYGIILCSYEGNGEKFVSKLNFLLSKMIDALIVFPSGLTASNFSDLQNGNLPLCLIDREIEGVNADVVMTDNKNAGYLATKYIIECGHRNIAFVSGYDTSYTANKRNQGIRKALSEYGIGEDEVVFVYCYNSSDIYEQIKSIFDNKVKSTIIFSTNFYLTNKTLNALNKLGKKVPDDISLLAFDNVDAFGIYPTKLTIMAQQVEEISEMCVKTLLERIKKPDQPREVKKLAAVLTKGDSIKDLKSN